MLSLSRHVIGHVVLAGTLVVATVVACGGSTSTGIGNPDPGSSSGTSGTSGTSGASGSSGQNCATAACPEIGCGPGTVSRTHEGQCCPTCDPIPNQCDGKADSCSNKKGCAEPEYERFEYAPGCCECRLAKCKGVTCPPFQSCGLGEHADLSGCCGVCVKDNDGCKNGATPCSTYQCPVGYKATGSPTSDGPNCCSSCEVDPNYCAAERNANTTFIATRLSDPAALKCQTKDDCVVANLTNACNGDCGHAVAKAQASQITNDVTTYGQQHCSQCPPQLVGCPAVVLVARCGNDQKCTLSPG